MSQQCETSYNCCGPTYTDYFIEPQTGNFLLIINSDPEDGGTTTGAGEYEQFSDVTVTATPAVDFDFVGFYDTFGNLLSVDNSYTFALINNMILIARFEAT